MFTSRVERQFEAAHHNGPPGHRCQTNHGHSWKAVVEFTYDSAQLSEYGWGPDFGAVKQFIDQFDHDDLNELLPVRPSAENLAVYIFQGLAASFGFAPDFVQIFEGGGNSITYRQVWPERGTQE